MNIGFERMEKILVAGPTLVTRASDALFLEGAVSHELSWHAMGRLHLGIIAAEDTITGKFAQRWANNRGIPFYGHKAFDSLASRLAEQMLSDRARQLIAARNASMMRDRCLTDALLFVQTYECVDFIDGLRKLEKPIRIHRVCA